MMLVLGFFLFLVGCYAPTLVGDVKNQQWADRAARIPELCFFSGSFCCAVDFVSRLL